jgi:hypothetical protein
VLLKVNHAMSTKSSDVEVGGGVAKDPYHEGGVVWDFGRENGSSRSVRPTDKSGRYGENKSGSNHDLVGKERGSGPASSQERFRYHKDYAERDLDYRRSSGGINCGPERCYAAPDTTRADLDKHFRDGGGQTVQFLGTDINLDYLPANQFDQTPGSHGLQANWATAFFSVNPHARMFGSFSANFISHEYVQLFDRYDFDPKPYGLLNNPLREIFTAAGRWRATEGGKSKGVGFNIEFLGLTKTPYLQEDTKTFGNSTGEENRPESQLP